MMLYAHPFSSYCQKALIAFYENHIPFELRLLGDEQSFAELEAIWPLKKMPVLVDDGRTIFEASMVIEYLGQRYPGPVMLIPVVPEDALAVRTLDRFFDNYVMTPMQKIVGDRIRPAEARDPHGVAEARRLLDSSYTWLDQALAGRTFAAGDDFSLADCAAAPSLHYADRVQPFRDTHPVLGAYLARLEARPSFARVRAEAEPYAHFYPTQDLFPAGG